MRPSKAEIIKWLLIRISMVENAAFVLSDHVQHWPPESLSELIRAGVLEEAGQADWIECRRCSRRCGRPVEWMLDDSGSRTSRPHTTCHLRHDVTVVPVRINRLRRWQTSRAAFARFIGTSLELRIRDPGYEAGLVLYQSARIAKYRFALSLGFDPGLVSLRLDAEERPLEELIRWNGGPPELDRSEIELWAAELGVQRTTPIGRLPSRRKQNMRKSRYAARNARWQALADDLAAADGTRKKSDIAEEIFRSDGWPGVDEWTTIERIIRVPRKRGAKKSPRRLVRKPL